MYIVIQTLILFNEVNYEFNKIDSVNLIFCLIELHFLSFFKTLKLLQYSQILTFS